jgi:cytochrome P450
MNAFIDSTFDHLLAVPEFAQNPYPVYHRLRDEAPVYWSNAWNCWILTRYDDVADTFKDPARYLNGGRFDSLLDALPSAVRAEVQPLENHFRTGLINSDPPDHTRLRALLHKAFTPRMIRQMEARIHAIVDTHLDRVAHQGYMDVLRDLAYPLPVIVIASMLGAPASDHEQFKGWSDDIIAFQTSGRTTREVILRSQRALLEMRAYLKAIFALRRHDPGDDLISAMVAAEEQGDRLTEEEMLTTCVTLLVAGHETTTNLIGSAVHALLHHPDQMADLRRDPSLMPAAVEEFLRYETPLQRNRKMVAFDLEFGGRHMRKGQLIMQVLSAANRDPAVFPDPDMLNIRRDPNPHIAFGLGIHFCLGAPLARVEAPIALRTLLERFPALRLGTTQPLEWQAGSVLRCLKALPVIF